MQFWVIASIPFSYAFLKFSLSSGSPEYTLYLSHLFSHSIHGYHLTELFYCSTLFALSSFFFLSFLLNIFIYEREVRNTELSHQLVHSSLPTIFGVGSDQSQELGAHSVSPMQLTGTRVLEPTIGCLLGCILRGSWNIGIKTKAKTQTWMHLDIGCGVSKAS